MSEENASLEYLIYEWLFLVFQINNLNLPVFNLLN